jgi:hypothetical protein
MHGEEGMFLWFLRRIQRFDAHVAEGDEILVAGVQQIRHAAPVPVAGEGHDAGDSVVLRQQLDAFTLDFHAPVLGSRVAALEWAADR